MMKLKETTAGLWGKKYKVTPYLVDRVWGDGKQRIWLSPMTIRPNFYVVRIDSKMDTGSDEWRDLLEEVMDAIEEEFGTCCETYSESGECECDHWATWPAMFEWGGCSWGDLTKTELADLGLQENPKPTKCPRCGSKVVFPASHPRFKHRCHICEFKWRDASNGAKGAKINDRTIIDY